MPNMLPTQSKFQGIIFSVIAAISFAFSLVLARVCYDYGTNPESILVVRFAVLLVLLLGWNLARGQSLRLPYQLAGGGLLIGISYFIGIGSYLSAVSYIPVSLAVLIFYTFPIVVTLLTATLAKRWPHPLQFLALIVAFIGLVISLGVEMEGLQTIGLIFATVASIGIAINMVASSYLLRHVPTTVFGFYMSVGTLLISLIVMTNHEGLVLPESTTGIWIFMGMLVSFIIGYFSVYNAIRIIGAEPASTTLNLEPIATILIAAVLLGELLTRQKILGGVIVLLGILMAQWPQLVAYKRKRYNKP